MILLSLSFFVFVIYSTEAIFLFFERESYEFFVSESIRAPSRIGFVQATASSSLPIQYELHGDTNRTFLLNPSSGELMLNHSLDYETMSIYKLTIEARSTSNIAPTFTELIIHVLNTNDNPPEINLIFYPSLVIQSNVLVYDRTSVSTPLATIYIKDIDQSTSNLTLMLNDTEHFQIQFVRQMRNGPISEAIFLLSTKNNALLVRQEEYSLLLNACDNDQPSLWTNRSYQFQLKSTESFCNLSLNASSSIIDIPEHLPNRSLILTTRTNKYCPKKFFSIDDTKHFYIDPHTGDLYTSTRFNRREQSIYRLQLQLNHQFKRNLTIRIVDEHQHRPFLTRKYFQINRSEFSSIDLINGTACRPQPMIYHSFELLANCTLAKVATPMPGKYLFYIQLNDLNDYEDTFILDLTAPHAEYYWLPLVLSPYLLALVITLASCFLLILIICILLMIRRHKYNRMRHNNHKQQRVSSQSTSEEAVHHRYDAVSTLTKLKVHDDHELSPSSTNTALYLVQRPSSPLSSSSPAREDEGYSGSSDVSDHPLPIEATILAANQLFEKYRIHDFRTRQSVSPCYDIPKRSSTSRISPDVSLV